MKHIIKAFFIKVIKLCSYIYSPALNKKLHFRINMLYTFWLASEFNNLGKNSLIEKPLYLKGGKYMSIGENFNALERLRLECWDNYQGEKFTPQLTIGNNVSVNYNVHIGCINQISIGNNVLFASNIFISDHQHGFIDTRDSNVPPLARNLYSKGPVIIEDNVWIGENVAILPNVTVGKGCIIGANAVVTKSFPENCVLGGNPAKIIRKLY